jgi:N-acetylglucosamine-6-phosphate deacetylase
MTVNYLYNVDIMMPDGILRRSSLTYGETVMAVGELCPDGAVARDGQGYTVWPGLIDIHTHGFGGRDTMDGGDAVAEIAKELPRFGVTSFLPTTVTGPWDAVTTALDGVRRAMGRCEGAEVLGTHLEGPFLSPRRLGAHDPRYARSPSVTWLDPSIIKLVTVAPELEGGGPFIRACRELGVRVSIGHTDAAYETCQQAVGWGAESFTHTFNAMSPFNHRKPGAAGAAMALDTYAELICDGIHVAPAAQSLLFRLKPERIILVTDSLMAAGLPEGDFSLGSMKGAVINGEARLRDGTLAGSILTMNEAVRNFIRFTGATAPQAAKAASENPAALLGLHKGRLRPGYDADFVLFDKDFNSRLTVVGGRDQFTVDFLPHSGV